MLKARLNKDKNAICEVIDYDAKIASYEKDYQLELSRNSCDDDTINIILNKPEDERSELEKQKVELRNSIDDELATKKKSLEEDYYDFEADDPSSVEAGEYDDLQPYIEVVDKKVYQRFKVIKNLAYKINAKISSLEAELSSTDYIIIKSYEAKITMSDAPYTDEYLTQITTQRQEIRDKINELQELLKTAN